jgi:hypothetical protein
MESTTLVSLATSLIAHINQSIVLYHTPDSFTYLGGVIDSTLIPRCIRANNGNQNVHARSSVMRLVITGIKFYT